VDSAGNVYISDTGNKCIREVTPAGAITTFVSGLSNPGAIAVDPAANLYFADGALIRKFSGGTLTTIAGAGVFTNPQGIASIAPATCMSPIPSPVRAAA
jgi:DNA-binding beta-propeller fold protein YncE